MPNKDYYLKNVREHLTRYRLFVNKLELVIIYRTYRFRLSNSLTAVVNYLAKKHNVPKSTTKVLQVTSKGLS